MKVACYCRVSRDDLNNENQVKVIQDYCDRNGFTELNWFKEEMSSRKTRPIKEQLIKDFRASKYDTIIVARIDRWARSLQELIMNVQEIVNGNGRFISIMNGFDFHKTSYNATQQLMLNIIGSFAEFEREIIRERTLEGLARAKAQGRIGGRKKGWRKTQ